MDRQASIREKMERVTSLYPDESERINKCSEIIFEQDHDWLYQAFDKQLDQILTTTNPQAAKKHIDRMEHTLTKSAIVSPFLGEGGKQRAWIITALVVLALILLTGIELLWKSGTV